MMMIPLIAIYIINMQSIMEFIMKKLDKIHNDVQWIRQFLEHFDEGGFGKTHRKKSEDKKTPKKIRKLLNTPLVFSATIFNNDKIEVENKGEQKRLYLRDVAYWDGNDWIDIEPATTRDDTFNMFANLLKKHLDIKKYKKRTFPILFKAEMWKWHSGYSFNRVTEARIDHERKEEFSKMKSGMPGSRRKKQQG